MLTLKVACILPTAAEWMPRHHGRCFNRWRSERELGARSLAAGPSCLLLLAKRHPHELMSLAGVVYLSKSEHTIGRIKLESSHQNLIKFKIVSGISQN